MVNAVILLNTDIGAEKEVLKQLKSVEGVEEAYILYSIYDIAVKIKANSIDKLGDIIKLKIRNLPNVFSVLTLLTVD